MKGSCKSLVELEYFFEEVYKATTDQLDWNNPKGQQYPHDLRKPLTLIPNSLFSRQPFDQFSTTTYVSRVVCPQAEHIPTSMTKTKAAEYGISNIEDLVPNTMWMSSAISYDKHALWGISHWSQKCQHSWIATNKNLLQDVTPKQQIIVSTNLQIVEWHNYKHLDWITIRRDDDKLYKFKEGDFNRLRIQDIKRSFLH
ncbi:hypothetical protein Tco_0729123 [Tanacetum coccineum]|uniref:Uncharacterized protein n=1 Tax=Tanacetum coccineum TaxID=301880 RepID=A0ABQ4YQR0_9ASTR